MAGHNADRMNTADDQPIVPDEPDGSGLSRRQVLTGAGTAGLLATVPVLRSMQRAAASRTPTGDGTPEQIHLGPVDRLDRRADTRDRLLLLEDRERLRPRYPREPAAAVRQIPGGPGAQRARPRLRTVLPGPRLRPQAGKDAVTGAPAETIRRAGGGEPVACPAWRAISGSRARPVRRPLQIRLNAAAWWPHRTCGPRLRGRPADAVWPPMPLRRRSVRSHGCRILPRTRLATRCWQRARLEFRQPRPARASQRMTR